MDYSGVIKVLSYLCHLHINVPAPSVEKWACLDCYSASASQTECVFIVNLAPRRVEIRTSSSFWCGFIYEIISLRIKNLLGKIFFFFSLQNGILYRIWCDQSTPMCRERELLLSPHHISSVDQALRVFFRPQCPYLRVFRRRYGLEFSRIFPTHRRSVPHLLLLTGSTLK